MATLTINMSLGLLLRRQLSERRRGRKYTVLAYRPKHGLHYSSADTREERAYFK